MIKLIKLYNVGIENKNHGLKSSAIDEVECSFSKRCGARCISDKHDECMATSEQQPSNHYAITSKLVTIPQKPAIL